MTSNTLARSSRMTCTTRLNREAECEKRRRATAAATSCFRDSKFRGRRESERLLYVERERESLGRNLHTKCRGGGVCASRGYVRAQGYYANVPCIKVRSFLSSSACACSLEIPSATPRVYVFCCAVCVYVCVGLFFIINCRGTC